MINRMMKSFVLLVLFSSITNATSINVPAGQPTIQQGIDASLPGDTVLVQPGTYVENINFNGHNIVLGSLFLTTEDTSYISQTIIDGDSTESVVIFEVTDRHAAIVGFTIQNGFKEHWGAGIYCWGSSGVIRNNIIIDNYGGGIYCGLDSWPVIQNNIII